MASFSWVQNPIGQLQTIAIIFAFSYVIVWHPCHRCVYFEVIFIVTIIFCTMSLFLVFKTYLLSVFLFSVFRWLGTFCNKMIFGSASKAFPIWTIWIFVWQSTSRTSFIFFFSDLFETFFHRMVSMSTICALCLGRVCFFIVSTRYWLTAVKIQLFRL